MELEFLIQINEEPDDFLQNNLVLIISPACGEVKLVYRSTL